MSELNEAYAYRGGQKIELEQSLYELVVRELPAYLETP